MIKISLVFLFFFGLEGIELYGFQMNKTTVKNNSSEVKNTESIVVEAIDFPNFEKDVSDSSASDESSNRFHSKVFDKNLHLVHLQANLQPDSYETSNNYLKEKNRIDQDHIETQESDLEVGLLSKIPFWVFGILLAFLGYTVFISIRFFSIYFQDVTIQEQLEIVTNDFFSYKRSTIEKERKLMRDLIDARTRIQELSEELQR
jgi:hypothetical protein